MARKITTPKSPEPPKPSHRERFLSYVGECREAAVPHLGDPSRFERDYASELNFAFREGDSPAEFVEGYVRT